MDETVVEQLEKLMESLQGKRAMPLHPDETIKMTINFIKQLQARLQNDK